MSFLKEIKNRFNSSFILSYRSRSLIICGFFSFIFLILVLQDSEAQNSCYKLVTKKSYLANLEADKIYYNNCLYGSEIKDLSVFKTNSPNSNGYQESKNSCYKFITRKTSIKNLLEDIVLYNNCLYQARLDDLNRRNREMKKRGEIPVVELKFQRL